jgi:hypothetical protein
MTRVSPQRLTTTLSYKLAPKPAPIEILTGQKTVIEDSSGMSHCLCELAKPKALDLPIPRTGDLRPLAPRGKLSISSTIKWTLLFQSVRSAKRRTGGPYSETSAFICRLRPLKRVVKLQARVPRSMRSRPLNLGGKPLVTAQVLA